jgi:hypothetical protein
MSNRQRYHHGRVHLGKRLQRVDRWRRRDWDHWEEARSVTRKCAGKVCWRADEVEEVRLKQELKAGLRLRSYFHPQCGYFHLTKKP